MENSDSEGEEKKERADPKEVERKQLLKWMQGRKYRKKLKLKGLKLKGKQVYQNCRRLGHVNGKNIFLYRNDGGVIQPGKGRRFVLKTSNNKDFEDCKEAILNSITDSLKLLLAARDLYTADGELINFKRGELKTHPSGAQEYVEERNWIGDLPPRSDVVVSCGESFKFVNMHRISPNEKKMINDGDIPVRCTNCGKYFKNGTREFCAIHTKSFSQPDPNSFKKAWGCCNSTNPDKKWCHVAAKTEKKHTHNWKPTPLPKPTPSKSSMAKRKRAGNKVVPIKGVIRYAPEQLSPPARPSSAGARVGPRLPSPTETDASFREDYNGVVPSERIYTAGQAQRLRSPQGRPQSAPSARARQVRSPTSSDATSALAAMGQSVYLNDRDKSDVFDDEEPLRVTVLRMDALAEDRYIVALVLDGREIWKSKESDHVATRLSFDTPQEKEFSTATVSAHRSSVLRVEVWRHNVVRSPELLGYRDVTMAGVLLGTDPSSQWIAVPTLEDDNSLVANVHALFEVEDSEGIFVRNRPVSPVRSDKDLGASRKSVTFNASTEGISMTDVSQDGSQMSLETSGGMHFNGVSDAIHHVSINAR